MSQILSYFGLTKPENKQAPMAAPKEDVSIGQNQMPLPQNNNNIPIPNLAQQNNPGLFASNQENKRSYYGSNQGADPQKRPGAFAAILETTKQPEVVQAKFTTQPVKSALGQAGFGQNQPVSGNSSSSYPLTVDLSRVRSDLDELGSRTFPNAFPSKPTYPDTFPNVLKVTPISLGAVQGLVDNSSTKFTSKENQINKFYNYKKETDFYKKYISMNDVKRQKLQQEINELKYSTMNQNSMAGHPEVERHMYMLNQHQQEIENEMQELQRLQNELGGSEYQNYQ